MLNPWVSVSAIILAPFLMVAAIYLCFDAGWTAALHRHPLLPGTCEVGSVLIMPDHTMYLCTTANGWKVRP